MRQLLHYLYNCNKKKIWVLYTGFITVSLILFFYMTGSSKRTLLDKQETTLILFTLLIAITTFSLFLLTMSSFRKITVNSIIRYTAISAKRYLYANVIFFILMFSLIFVTSIIFLYFFSFYISEVQKVGLIQQLIKNLYSYGMIHHFFSMFLWLVDLVNLLVMLIFISVIIKAFRVKPGIGKILFVFAFLVSAGIYGFSLDIVEKMGNSIIFIKYAGVTNERGYFDTSFYPYDGLNVFSLCYECLLTFVLVSITSYIIDKKLEV
ncbi:ABC transporter permease [Bacillus sp. NPDC094106]|uniref:ABC transporter permease n=1 Tax=Bacillus sp. NPDC094106 TaxID=3363949 RepID=UPI0037FA00F9